MKSQHFRDAWSTIDHDQDPRLFVRFLDATAESEDPSDWPQLRAHIGSHQHQHILDVGCGLGSAVRVMAKMVGSNGRVVGVDSSETMLQEAKARSVGFGFSADFYKADAQRLPFKDETFDFCTASSLLEYVPQPEQALDEMIRVVKPGGCIAVTAFDSYIFDSPQSEVTRKILSFVEQQEFNQWMGRRLYGLFRSRSLRDVIVLPRMWVAHDFAITRQLTFGQFVERAQAAGAVTADEADTWLGDLEQRSQAGHYLAASTWFYARGRKPEL